jgi:hypothetical protein
VRCSEASDMGESPAGKQADPGCDGRVGPFTLYVGLAAAVALAPTMGLV